MHNPTTIPIGEKGFILDGPAGLLEGITYGVEHPRGVGIICHPHPLHEGTMNNKVVHIVSRAFNTKGLSTVRFNYRGVGKSEGTFGESKGEIADLLAIIDWVNIIMPETKIWLAGFSFGAYIAASGAQLRNCQQLFSISPAVHHQPYESIADIHCPWVVIQSMQDEVVPPEKVYQWFDSRVKKTPQPMSLMKVEGSHYYHGKLTILKVLIEDHLVNL